MQRCGYDWLSLDCENLEIRNIKVNQIIRQFRGFKFNYVIYVWGEGTLAASLVLIYRVVGRNEDLVRNLRFLIINET